MGRLMTLLTALAVFSTMGTAAKKRRLVDPVIRAGRASAPRTDSSGPPCKNYVCAQAWLTRMPINHFEVVGPTFQMQ